MPGKMDKKVWKEGLFVIKENYLQERGSRPKENNEPVRHLREIDERTKWKTKGIAVCVFYPIRLRKKDRLQDLNLGIFFSD